MLILNNCLIKHVYIIVITSYTIIFIITAFNYLYCLLSTQMKNTFLIGLVRPGWMCGQSLRKASQGVLQLLIVNDKVTDRPTNRHVQSYMPSLLRRGGIKTLCRDILVACM